ncbi:hypothetical protein [Arenibaculum pallidiluteum]|uniref:hypothetical protein n=1 Tax=Arenibaculum pallidiluteum TaxID=2812559 RepID=UPI001A977103|nr:hypothetical protein [Arenibaculum pallidiluteum]
MAAGRFRRLPVVALASALAAGCAERDADLGMYGWNASMVQPGGGASADPTAAAMVVPSDRSFGGPPGAEILFGHPGLRVEIACEALQSGLPRLDDGAPWRPLATRWPDERAADEMTAADARDCPRLADFYDFARAAPRLASLGLPGAAGPVLAGRAADEGPEIVVDLSSVPVEEMRRAVGLWRDRITREPRFWDAHQGEAFVRAELQDLTARYGLGVVASR